MRKIYAKLNKLYCCFILNGDSIQLRTAERIINSYNGADADIKLCIARAIINIELGNIEKGRYFLAAVDKYRKFLRTNEPAAYSVYLFAQGLANIKKNRITDALKYIERLNEEYKLKKKHSGVLSAYLCYTAGIYQKESFFMLINCYRYFERSRILYVVLLRFYKKNNVRNSDISNSLIKWGVNHNVGTEFIINEYKGDVSVKLTDPSGFVIKLYEKYPYDFILAQVVKYFAFNFDYCENALKVYNIALRKGLSGRELFESTLMAAVKNNNNDLPDKIYDYFIKNPIESRKCMCKVYMRDIRRGQVRKDILKFAVLCQLDSNFTNYDMSAYLYMYGKSTGAADALIEKAGRDTANNIFSYITDYNEKAVNVSCAAVKRSYSKDNEIIKIKNCSAIVKSASENFSVVLLDGEHRVITGVEVNVTPVVSYIYPELVFRLYADGYRSDEILIYIADYILDRNICELKYINVLKEAIKTGIRTEDIIYRLFYIYAENGDRDNAEFYIEKTDIDAADEIKLEYMAKKTMEFKKYGIAEKLLPKYKKINKILVEKLLVFLYEKEPEKAAYFAYKLIMDDFSGADFLDFVFKSYKGNRADWNRFLNKISLGEVRNVSVSSEILKKCVEYGLFTEYFENNFYFIYYNGDFRELTERCIDFICKMVMGKDCYVAQSTINIFEDFFEKTGDYMTAFALGHIYIRQNVSTRRSHYISEEIVKICEKTNISFPIFYNSGDEVFRTPFIIKNKPLMYRTKENVKVTADICFDEAYTVKKEMTELKYGIYILLIPVFSGENISYSFEERINGNSVATHVYTDVYPDENKVIIKSDDVFFAINNSINSILSGDYYSVEKTLENLVFTDKNSDFKLL